MIRQVCEDLRYKAYILRVPLRYVHNDLRARFYYNRYEVEESYLINKYITKQDKVLEIGACLGYTTLLLADNSKSVIAVEANPELGYSLIETMELNNKTNVKIFSGVINTKKGTSKFATFDNVVMGSAHRKIVDKAFANSCTEYEIINIHLKDITDIDKVNTLVMDIEGGELDFLKKHQVFMGSVNKVIVEVHQWMMEDQEFCKKCLTELRKAGLVMTDIANQTWYLTRYKL